MKIIYWIFGGLFAITVIYSFLFLDISKPETLIIVGLLTINLGIGCIVSHLKD